ncbi:transposable element Tcb2 transposase [Trichonephila clavipes]|nr:transposable element Tcb2 transposase [Trichonephila clavipes]
MSQQSHLTDSEAWRVVGRLEGGQTQTEVAQAIGVLQSVISRIWNQFLETESAGRRQGQGRRWATTPNEDHYLVLTARRHRNMNATVLQQHLCSASGTTVLTQTVRSRLHGLGLYAHQPMVCFRLTTRHRRDHREWATGHVNWRRNEWSNVLFLTSPVFLFIRVIGVFSSGGTVAVGIILRSCTKVSDLQFREYWFPYAAAIRDDFILIDDNCRPHHANLVEDFLLEEGIVQMEWPAYSPNMNPTEHVWDTLGRRVAGRQPPPQTIQDLERALLEELDRIPQLGINSLIDSMPHRTVIRHAVLDLNGPLSLAAEKTGMLPAWPTHMNRGDTSQGGITELGSFPRQQVSGRTVRRHFLLHELSARYDCDYT